MVKQTKEKNTFLVQSDSNKNTWYSVNIVDKTCTCLHYTMRLKYTNKTCKHYRKCLKEIERVVKKNGYILLTVWAMEQPESKVKKVKNINFKEKDSLVPYYNREDGKYYYRYYRIYSEFDFNNEINHTNLIIKKSYNENGNWVYWIENNKT